MYGMKGIIYITDLGYGSMCGMVVWYVDVLRVLPVSSTTGMDDMYADI